MVKVVHHRPQFIQVIDNCGTVATDTQIKPTVAGGD
jgi:hypothetical protein